jgi:hypothetical protein
MRAVVFPGPLKGELGGDPARTRQDFVALGKKLAA